MTADPWLVGQLAKSEVVSEFVSNINHHFVPMELATESENDSDIETDGEEEGNEENYTDNNKKVDLTEKSSKVILV